MMGKGDYNPCKDLISDDDPSPKGTKRQRQKYGAIAVLGFGGFLYSQTKRSSTSSYGMSPKMDKLKISQAKITGLETFEYRLSNTSITNIRGPIVSGVPTSFDFYFMDLLGGHRVSVLPILNYGSQRVTRADYLKVASSEGHPITVLYSGVEMHTLLSSKENGANAVEVEFHCTPDNDSSAAVILTCSIGA